MYKNTYKVYLNLHVLMNYVGLIFEEVKNCIFIIKIEKKNHNFFYLNSFIA